MDILEKTLKALANKNRLRIVKMLEKKNLCVCEITAVLGIKQPSVTAHLLKLKSAGIIGERQNGLYTEFFIIRKTPLLKIWKVLSQTLDNSPSIKKDILKIRGIDRHKICK
ncbi:MAG: winged helix-turn-helix transcriptional regulator [Candidatus Omnitrophica bacterium]|nr:winged helix-turn-helix transcriptional regulator [Candidatus Omnitrophota bacterium]